MSAPGSASASPPRTVESRQRGRFGDRDILLSTKDGRLVCVAPAHQEDVLAHFDKPVLHAADVLILCSKRSRPTSPRGASPRRRRGASR